MATRDDLLALTELGNSVLDDASATADELLSALDAWLYGAEVVRTVWALRGALALREGVRLRHGDATAEVLDRMMLCWANGLETLVDTAIALADG